MNSLLGKNKFRALLGIVIVLSLILTACGGNTNNAPNSTPNATLAATPAVTAETLPEGAEELAPTEFERKKVGDELVVYSAGPAGLANNVLEGFQEKHGIKVEM